MSSWTSIGAFDESWRYLLGSGRRFDRAIARFSTAYADQNELDHERLADAVAGGEVLALGGV